MRRLALLALVGCGIDPQGGGRLSLVLDIPNGTLDPEGFTTVEVTLHSSNGETVRSASVGPQQQFTLGELDPIGEVWVEAALRNDSGTVVGYGRTAGAAMFEAGAEIVVPVRRPIIYFAGQVSIDGDGDPFTDDPEWSTVPATFSDLSIGTNLDGTPRVGSKAVLMVGAGPSMFLVEQATSNPLGTLTGPASIIPVSMGDHATTAPLTGKPTGGVLDGAGSEDGSTLAIGTTTNLFVIETATGAMRAVASGSFSRVAIINGTAGPIGAVAVKNRPSTTAASCSTNAELVWVGLPAVDGAMVKSIATGSFTDVAASGGQAYYVDCAGELGEIRVDETGIMPLRMQLGRTTALAVTDSIAYIGVEELGTPATLTLLALPLAGTTAPRTLWTEAAQQILNARDYPGVQRQLGADEAVIHHLEIGAGGDYVAATMTAHHFGARVASANFPQMDIDTEELRVFDPASGSVVQRYRSWCDGLITYQLSDIRSWECATATGQSAPASFSLEHHIGSMAFLFGRK